MKKSLREIVKIARQEGVEHARVEGGSPHGRLCGFVAGRPMSMVVSATKAMAYRYQQSTILNIRREVRRLREEASCLSS